MKGTKRIASAAAALVLTLSMAAAGTVTAFAAESPEEFTITVKDSSVNSEAGYTAFQIASGEVKKSETGEKILDTPQVGKDITLAKLVTAVNSVVAEADKVADDADIYDVLSAVEKLSADNAKAFAKAVYDNKTGDGTKIDLKDGGKVTPGYYVIVSNNVDKENGKTEAKTLNMLKVLDSSVEIEAKESAPTITKKIGEEKAKDIKDDKYGTRSTTDDGDITTGENDTYTYNDAADHTKGEVFPIIDVGTLPDTYGDYDTYKYIITDTNTENIEIVDKEKITVKVVDSNGEEKVLEDGKDGVTIEVKDVDEKGGDNDIVVTITDLKKFTDDKDAKVIVEYPAKLTDNAKIANSADDNEQSKVGLEYSANPYDSEDTDKTPEDVVIVYTYGLKLTKTNVGGAAVENDTKAEFTIQEKDGKYFKVTDGSKGTFTLTNNAADAKNKLNADGTILLNGIDDGTYIITEVTPPEGYKLLEAPVEVTVKGGIIVNQEWGGTAGDAIKVDGITISTADTSNMVTASNKEKDGQVEVDIKNTAIGVLPETGGMGTKLFYLAGGAAVVASGVLLVAKRRASKAE